MKAHPAGLHWERLAERFLRRRGLRTLARNFHCRMGEVDLVMGDGDTTVFIEVRYRRNNAFGSALDTVTRHKQLKLIRTASLFLARKPLLASRPCRFDVVGISGSEAEPQIEWARNAFELPSD